MLYMPIIKSKRGELTAVKLLDSETKQQIIPFLDAIPPNPFADKPKKLAAHMTWVADHFADAWEAQGEVFVDTFDIGPAIVEDKQVAIEYLCRALREKDVRVIPVTGIQREPAHDIAVARLLAESSIGVCIRLEEEDIVLPKKIGSLLEDKLKFFHEMPNNVDLVLDLRLLNVEALSSRVNRICLALQSIPDLDAWRRVILAGSAMPNSLEGICDRGATSYLERYEWSTWVALHEEKIDRLPNFGDYTIIPPQFVEMDTRTIAKHLGPNVKYTLDSRWFIARGESFQKSGSKQYFDIAKAVTKLSGFRGATASYGDRFIDDRASGQTLKPGNPEQWVTASVNSHITWQVRSLQQT